MDSLWEAAKAVLLIGLGLVIVACALAIVVLGRVSRVLELREREVKRARAQAAEERRNSFSPGRQVWR